MKRIYTFLLAALLCAPLFAQEAGSVSYYIVGNMNVWTTDSNYLMTLNTQAETEEYVYLSDLGVYASEGGTAPPCWHSSAGSSSTSSTSPPSRYPSSPCSTHGWPERR